MTEIEDPEAMRERARRYLELARTIERENTASDEAAALPRLAHEVLVSAALIERAQAGTKPAH